MAGHRRGHAGSACERVAGGDQRRPAGGDPGSGLGLVADALRPGEPQPGHDGGRVVRSGVEPRRGGQMLAQRLEAVRRAQPAPRGVEPPEVVGRQSRRSGEAGDEVLHVERLPPAGQHAHELGTRRGKPAGQHAQVPQSRRRDRPLRLGQCHAALHVVAVGPVGEARERVAETPGAGELAASTAAEAAQAEQPPAQRAGVPSDAHDHQSASSISSSSSLSAILPAYSSTFRSARVRTASASRRAVSSMASACPRTSPR